MNFWKYGWYCRCTLRENLNKYINYSTRLPSAYKTILRLSTYLSTAGGGGVGSGSVLGGSGSLGISGSFIFRGCFSIGFLVFLETQVLLLVGGGDFGAVGRGIGSGLGGG